MDAITRQKFIEDYRTIRHAEQRGSDDAAYYLALPYEDISGKNADQWAIRGKSYRYFETKILPRLEKHRPLDILDLGAGNCWMSHRLALRKHKPTAVDIFTDSLDGLQASRHYPVAFPVLQAQFDQLPFAPASFDVAIFNASLHYSPDYHATLREVRRCLRPHGSVIIIDSPVYELPSHGERMREERHSQFEKQYGFRSDALPSREYLDRPMLKVLASDLGITWESHQVWYGWKWFLRPWKARMNGKRPPSQFLILRGGFAE